MRFSEHARTPMRPVAFKIVIGRSPLRRGAASRLLSVAQKNATWMDHIGHPAPQETIMKVRTAILVASLAASATASFATSVYHTSPSQEEGVSLAADHLGNAVTRQSVESTVLAAQKDGSLYWINCNRPSAIPWGATVCATWAARQAGLTPDNCPDPRSREPRLCATPRTGIQLYTPNPSFSQKGKVHHETQVHPHRPLLDRRSRVRLGSGNQQDAPASSGGADTGHAKW